MAMHPQQPVQPGPSTSGTGVVSIGPAGSTYTSMEQSGQSLLKTYCDEFPSTDLSFIIPPMFNSVYTEVMPEHSRGLNKKEKNKYDGALKNQSGERAEKMIYDMINEIIRKDKSRNPILALFNVKMDNDNKIKVRKHALLSELHTMDFTGIKISGEFDCIIVVKDLGTIHIEVKRTNNASNIALAEDQLDSGVQFVTNLMSAIRGSQSIILSVRLIAIPCESSKSPSCKTASGSFVAHNDICQNFTSTWNKMMKELEANATRNQFTAAEFKTFCNILMGWYCSEPVNQGSIKTCISNDSCLSLPTQVASIDEKVQRAEITSEEQNVKKDIDKQAPLSDIIRTDPMDIFQNASGIGLLYLTPTQHSLYYQFPQAIVHGHGGTGKTILCLMKIMDLVRSGANRKALFVAPSPSHLYCHSIFVKNKFNACIVNEVPLAQEANCDIVIITLNDFFNGSKIDDENNFIGYDILVDDLQDYYNENLSNDSNLNKIEEFMHKHFVVAKNNNLIAWFSFDIVQSTSLEYDRNNLICFFPRLDPQSAPPVVNLRFVLRNTCEIISAVEEGRNTAVATTLNNSKIVQEFYKGHLITSNRVQCHRLNSSESREHLGVFVLEMLRCEIDTLTKTGHGLQFSHIAILVDNDVALAEYQEIIHQMLLQHFNKIYQTIEEWIISQQKDRVILDVAKNVASFESPNVMYIRTDSTGQIYRIMSRARTKLTIIDVTEGPLPYKSVDSIEWIRSNNGFYNVSEFMDALKNKDFEEIGKLITENSDCLQLRSGGLTAFLMASQLGIVDTIKSCINLGANLFEREPSSGQTSAMLAARYGHLEALKYLVSNGVPIEEEDNDGNTVLYHAVEGGNVECTKWIIQNYLHNTSTTLLHCILQKEVIAGNINVLEILRDQGISLEDIDSSGNTILHNAVNNKQIECVGWIIRNYPQLAYVKNNENCFIFHEMASAGNYEMLQILYDNGIFLDKVDSNGNTILDYAAIDGQTECFNWVIHNYPQLVEALKRKLSVLHHVAEEGNCDCNCIAWILQNCQQLIEALKRKTCVLHQAAKEGNFEILEVLRDQGMNLEEADNEGNTILHHAVLNRNHDCFAWILQNHPQLVDTTKFYNSSLLLEVASGGVPAMLEMLCNHEEKLRNINTKKSPLHEAAICQSNRELRTLIDDERQQGGCDLNDSNVFLQLVYGDKVTIFRENGLVFKSTYSTVYTSLASLHRGCKVYYEIEVLKNESNDSFFRLGLINSHFLPPENCRNEDDSYFGTPPMKSDFKRYTVGVATDLMQSQILYMCDWNDTEVVTFPKLEDTFGLYVAISGQSITLYVNFGAKEFKYLPPDSSYKSLEELMNGTSILHLAAHHNKAEWCKYIVDTYPHSLNKISGRGTPLHECASTGSFNSLKVLLDAGADMTVTNIFGLTALDMAQINEQPECVKELERRLDGEEVSASDDQSEGVKELERRLNGEEPSVSKGKKSLLSRLKQNFSKK